MAEIDNRSDFPHAWFEKTGPGGISYDVLALRGTFDLAGDGRALQQADEQSPIVWADEYDGPAEGNPMQSVLLREGDLSLFKPATDVYVTGTAWSSNAGPQRSWTAGVRIGPVRQLLQLHGPRRFERKWGHWRLTKAAPVESVPLDYRHAFGGCFASEASERLPAEFACKPDNPAGCGWLPDNDILKALSDSARSQISARIAKLRELPAPRIEDPYAPIAHPDDRRPGVGFSPLARWCQPRQQYAGTYDERWQSERYPLLPEDFDLRFYQAAPPGLICPGHLSGDEVVMLEGLLPEGPISTHLPGVLALASITTAAGKRQKGRLLLDTVAIDLDARQVSLVWRSIFERDDPVRRVALGAFQPADARISVPVEEQPDG